MALKAINQQLSKIEPYYTDDLSVPYDVNVMRDCLSEIIKPIWTPLQPQYPVEITDDNNKQFDNDAVMDEILSTLGDTRNTTAEDNVNSLWKNTLAFFKGGLTASEVFVAQANGKANAMLPTPTVIYVPQDLKDACKQYISDPNRDDSGLIVNASFYMNEPCLMFHFLSKFTFDDFKAYVANVTQTISGNLTPDVTSKLQDFNNMKIDLVEGLILRKNDTDDADPYSFSRILTRAAIDFAKQSPDCGVIAPYIDELLCPKNIVFLDVDQIAKAPANKLTRALTDVKDGIKTKYKPLSLNKINKLSTAATSKRRLAAQIQNHQQMMNQNAQKRGIFKFRKVAMTKTDLSKAITKIVKKETNVSSSENYSKTIKSSFQRANRRKPDDYNLPGKSISMQYKPDIHIYLDTSGSISEDNYKEAILTLITLAKKMNVNLYFNSFSHTISKQTKLKVAGKSIQGIYKEFQSVPKVTGGTQYHIVWDYIMRSPKRRKEISLMITDFEYYPPSKRVDYPPKLYYAPIATSPAYWKYMVDEAEQFCKNMYHIDKNIRKHILMN